MKLTNLRFLTSLIACCTISGISAQNLDDPREELLDVVYTYSFDNVEIGKLYPSYWGGDNADIKVTADPAGGDGHCLYICGGNVREGTDPVKKTWFTKTRIIGINCPKGFNMSQLKTLSAQYYTTQGDHANLNIEFLEAAGGGQNGGVTASLSTSGSDDDVWNTAVFNIADYETLGPLADNTSTQFTLAIGMDGSSQYYIGDIEFVFSKPCTYREYEEYYFDKDNAKVVTLDFDDMPTGPSANVGTNLRSTNRTDMIIDKSPTDDSNNCVHIIYNGSTSVVLWDCIKAPEGHTLDDLRLVEYDIYETEIPGQEQDKDPANAQKNGSPTIKFKEANPWGAQSDVSTCGNTSLPTTNEWHTVSFAPSQVVWNNTDHKATLSSSSDINMAVGFYPCLNQSYVDNVKLYFAKPSQTTGLEHVRVEQPEVDTVTVYNIQGLCLMRNASKESIQKLPAGLYIVNGKKIKL